MTKPYTFTRPFPGGTGTLLDVEAFTRDLAEALGGTYQAASEACDRRDFSQIVLGETVLTCRKVWGASNSRKVSVHASHRDFKSLPYGETPSDLKWPEATVSVDRPMAALAKDVLRRVVEPAAPVNARLLGLLDKRNERCRSLGIAMASLATSFPALQVSRKDCDAHSAQLYLNSGGLYLSGELRPGGEVSIERLGALSPERFRLVMEAVTKPLPPTA